MKYFCKACNKDWDFSADVKYCPACTNPLIEINESAEDFKMSCINKIIGYFNEYIETECSKVKRQLYILYPSFSTIDFKETYLYLRKSENRKQLFERIVGLLEKLELRFTSEFEKNANIAKEKFSFDGARVQESTNKALEKIQDRFAEFGIHLNREKSKDVFPSFTCVLNIDEHRRKQFEELSSCLTLLLEVFRKIIDNNSLYSAFIHDENYGRGLDRFYWLFGMAENKDVPEQDGMEDDEVLENAVAKVLAEAKQSLSNEYVPDPLFDDDNIKPYVVSFWNTLAMTVTVANRVYSVSYCLDIEHKSFFSFLRKSESKSYDQLGEYLNSTLKECINFTEATAELQTVLKTKSEKELIAYMHNHRLN